MRDGKDLRSSQIESTNLDAVFQRICEMDLEGIIAKHSTGPYVTDRERSTWFKIRNRSYSQMEGRVELFERERHTQPESAWSLNKATTCYPLR